MKALLFLLILFLNLNPTVSANPNELLLQTLDEALAVKSEYARVHENRTKILMRDFSDRNLADEEKYRLCMLLFENYQYYNCDSALVYAEYALQLANSLANERYEAQSRLAVSKASSIMGIYNESLEYLREVDPETLDESLYKSYLNTRIGVYESMSRYVGKNERAKAYKALSDRYRDSLLLILAPHTTDYYLIGGECKMAKGEYQRAEQLLQEGVAKLSPESREMAYLTYTLGELYGKTGDTEKQIRAYAQSALCDVKWGIKENLSLSKLAVLLFEKGDIDRAYYYINNSIDDSTFSGARLRTLGISEVLPVIVEAYQQKRTQQTRWMWVFIVVISVLVVAMGILWLFTYRQMKRLAEARKALDESNQQLGHLNAELEAINRHLSESNEVKEGYIGHFLNLCSDYIEKLENYKKLVNRKITSGQIAELQQMTASDKLVDSELKSFYKNFDQTFLFLYPSFVQEFNQLLRQEDRFELHLSDGLNTELRIFALVRLGITDSSRIAAFLRYSAQTIYNYRTRVRNRAIGDRDEFEEQVRKIAVHRKRDKIN